MKRAYLEDHPGDDDSWKENRPRQRMRRNSAGAAMEHGQSKAETGTPSVNPQEPRKDTEDDEGKFFSKEYVETQSTGPSESESRFTLQTSKATSPDMKFSKAADRPLRQPNEPGNGAVPWGFVVYRTVYGDDAEWTTFKANDAIIASEN